MMSNQNIHGRIRSVGVAKRPFTLLELLLCLSLLVLASTWMLGQTKELVDYYRFERSVSKFEQEISLSKTLAITSHHSITFELWREGKRFIAMRRCQGDLQCPGVFDRPIAFPGIRGVSFQACEKDRLEVTFTSSGWIVEEGIVQFRGRDPVLTRSVDLH